ncbi:MAG: pentapeptide repeat-containing protein, partial [Nitrospiraceae bacterium]
MNRTYAGVCAVHALLIAVLAISVPGITQAAEPSQAISHSTRCESPYKKKAVPPKQLQAIVESHGQWLEHRENPEFQRADLCQADLRHAKLAGADLERARLEGAVLRQANLSQSNFSQASLAGADLTKARLEDSNLTGADL